MVFPDTAEHEAEVLWLIAQMATDDDPRFVGCPEAEIHWQGDRLFCGTSPAPYFHQTLG